MRYNRPPEYNHYYNTGIMFLNSGNYEKALSAFEQARGYWDDSYAYSGMGRAYYGLREYLLALTNFQIACQKYSGNLQAAHWRAKTLARLKRYNEAEALFKNVLNLLSNGPVPFYQEVLADYEEMKDERDGGHPEISDGRNLSYMNITPAHQQPATRVFIQGNQGPVNVGGIQATGDGVVNRSNVESRSDSKRNEDIGKQTEDPNDKYLQLVNEYENFRNRSKRDLDSAVYSATKKIALDMIDVLDNFERAIKYEDEKQIDGLIQIHKYFLAALTRNGIEKIDAEGKIFDPNFHEAISCTPSDKPEGTIIGVTLSGYMLQDKVLRHAQVTVARGVASSYQTLNNERKTSNIAARKIHKGIFSYECSNCGQSVNKDASYCPKCGGKFE